MNQKFLEASKQGDLLKMKMIFANNTDINPAIYDNLVFMMAAKYKHLDVCQWLVSLIDIGHDIKVNSCENYAFRIACENGDLEMCKWLWSLNKNINPHDWCDYAFRIACENGHLEVCQWLLTITEIPRHVILETFRKSSIHGRLIIIKWLFDNNDIDPTHEDNITFVWACENGHLEIAQWLLSLISFNWNINPCACDNWAFKLACENGHLEIVKWLFSLREFGFNIDPSMHNSCVFVKACSNGHLEIVKWLFSLREFGFNIDPTTCDNISISRAIENGHLEIVKWLFSLKNSKINIMITSEINFKWIIYNEHINTVKFLLSLDIAIPHINHHYNDIKDLTIMEQNIRNGCVIHKEILNTLQEILPVPYGISEMIYLYLYNSHNTKYQIEYEKLIMSM